MSLRSVNKQIDLALRDMKVTATEASKIIKAAKTTSTGKTDRVTKSELDTINSRVFLHESEYSTTAFFQPAILTPAAQKRFYDFGVQNNYLFNASVFGLPLDSLEG